jgi:PAS domain S-box-containing protein
MDKETSVDQSNASSILLSRVLEGLPFGTIVIDRNLNIAAANTRTAQLLEIEPTKLTAGSPIDALFSLLSARGDYGDDDRAIVAHILNHRSIDDATFTQKCPSGATLGVSIRAINGERLLTIEDLSDAYAEREALARSAQQMRSIFDTSPIGVAIVGSGGRLLYTNRRHDELYGVTAEQMPKNVRELYVEPAQRDRLLEIFRRDGRLINAEIHNRRPDGGTFWSLLSWNHTEYDGQPALISWIYDISDRKKAEAAIEEARHAAEQANKTKSDFLANMSHELRTPLNAIIGYSEILLEDAGDRGDEATVADLQKIQGAGKHLLGLINSILDLSKIEAGRMDVYLEQVFLSKLIEDVRTIVEPLVTKNGNRLVIECPADIGLLRTDLTKLKQCLINLISNAAKFTKEGDVKLTVARMCEIANVRFAVSDSGIGMTEEQVGRLFHAFVQADSSTTRNFGGTGLGLTITRHFCTMLGGRIDVASAPGVGSTFTIELPDHAPNTASISLTDRRTAKHDRSGRSLTVLVVDDDPAVHDVLSATLGKEGYNVLHAADGAEALEVMRKMRPDIVTLDVMMPKIDGWSLLGMMKSDGVLQSIPVIMLTIVDDRNLGFSLGASEFMTKPIDRQRLIALIQQFAGTPGDAPVLIVDDDAEVRSIVRQTINGVGLTAAEAENGRVALHWLNHHTPPALILLDLMMPEMDGFEFLERMRESEPPLDVPVVVLTAKAITQDERIFLAERTILVLSKGAQPIGSLGHALAAIAERGASVVERTAKS